MYTIHFYDNKVVNDSIATMKVVNDGQNFS